MGATALGVRKPESWSRAIFSHAIRRHGAHSNGGVIVQLGEIDCGNVIHLRRGSVQDGAVEAASRLMSFVGNQLRTTSL